MGCDDAFDGGYGWMNMEILRRIYVLDKKSSEKRREYEEELRKKDSCSYSQFLRWKTSTEDHIINMREVLLNDEKPCINPKYLK